MKQVIKVFFIGLLAGLSACTGAIRSEVATFHKLTAPAGESYMVEALDPKKQAGLELGHYIPLLKAELDKLGYHEADEGTKADLTVRMDFEIAPAREEIRQSAGSSFGRFGYGYGSGFSFGLGFGGGHWNGMLGYNSFYNPYYYGMYDPFFHPFGYYGIGRGWGHGWGYGGMWSMHRPRIVKVYDHHFEMNITRGATDIVFEGKATTKRRRKDMQKQMPVLVAAMFKEFPGESGKHRRVMVELPKSEKK